VKTFANCAAQGDVLFRRVEEIPADAELVESTGTGNVVVAHSETGHDHVFRDPTAAKLYRTGDPFICYLRMEAPAALEHLREFDTHEAIMFGVGCYQIRRQREHTPEGYRMVAD
jgi:hypothetical protein